MMTAAKRYGGGKYKSTNGSKELKSAPKKV